MRIIITRREALDIPDGINAFIFSLADALVEIGHNPLLMTSTYSSVAESRRLFSLRNRFPLICLSRNRNPSHFEILKSWYSSGRQIIESLNPDIVLINGALPFKLWPVSCTICHDVEKRWAYPGVCRRLYKIVAYRMGAITVATCNELKQALAKELVMRSEQITVIPTCIRVSDYQGLELPRRQKVVVHLGTAPYKNPGSTIHAFARVPGEDVRLFLVGADNRIVENALLRVGPTVRRRIEIVRALSGDGLRSLLGTARVVSVPSIYRAAVASPTALESLASGTPVVGSESISRSILQDGVNGYRVEPYNIFSIANCFDRLLRDDALWERLSVAARASVDAFSSCRIAASYAELCARARALKKLVPGIRADCQARSQS